MKRFVFALSAAAVLCLSSNVEASITGLLAGALGSNLTFFDESREVFVDVDGNGFLGTDDALVGYARVDVTSPPATPGGNEIYAVFSQTFGTLDFPGEAVGIGTRYDGTFIATTAPGSTLDALLPANSLALGGFSGSAMIAFIEVAGGFSEDLTSVALGGSGVLSKITGILDAEGTVAFTAGISDPADFFAFETAILTASTNYITGGVALTDTILTTLSLGNFGAGLSITDNFLGPNVIFNRVLETLFFHNNGAGMTFGFDTVAMVNEKYDLTIFNGNFGGIFENPGTVQNGSSAAGELSFINNADAAVNATVIPEPASVAIWFGVGVIGFACVRRQRRRKLVQQA
jgi:hypothetical protein